MVYSTVSHRIVLYRIVSWVEKGNTATPVFVVYGGLRP